MLKFAVIGTSWISNSYIDGALKTGLWELTAVYSRSFEKGRSFAEPYGVNEIYTDLEKFSKSDKFDAVYVASPNVLHYDHCKVLLNSRKHVICEKPMTSYSYQIKELVDIANKNNVIFMEAIMFMHQPTKKLLENYLPKVGKISMCTFDFCQRSSKYDAYLSGNLPNIFNPKMHTGALMDLGVYCLYPVLYLFGKPESFTVNMHKLDTGVDSMGSIIFNYNDKIVNLRFSKISESCAKSDIQGCDGSIYIDSISKLTNLYFVSKTGHKEVIFNDEDKETLMGNEAISFYNFIQKMNSTEFYNECSNLSILVCEYLEKIREIANLPF